MSNSNSDTQHEIKHGFLTVSADVSVALSLLTCLQRDAEHLPEIYNIAEGIAAILSRIGYMNQHVAHLVSPEVLDPPDADMWMPTLGLKKGKS